MEKNRIVTHGYPKESVRLAVHDDVYGQKYSEEILAAKKVSERTFKIESVPFITYGYNLGDVVKVDDKGYVLELTQDGGHFGYRISIPDHKGIIDAESHMDSVVRYLESKGYIAEVFNHKIAAIDASSAGAAIKLEKLIEQLIREGLVEEFDTVR